MRAGRLRNKVTIQKYTDATSSYGGGSGTWSDVCTVRASIESLSTNELFSSQQENNILAAKIRIRYRDDLKPDMRVVHGDDTYDITGILHDERKREMTLMAVKRYARL